MEEEPDDTIFVISIEDQKKIIGGRKAEKQVITFFHKEGGNLGGLRIGIFVNYIPSLEFVQNLSYIGQDVIIARKLTKTNKPALQMLSNKFCNAREFAEDDWIELGRTLQLPVDGISHQKAIELEEFKTYLEKPKGKT